MSLIIIGIDALDPDVVARMVEAGELPTIASLMQRGASGTLASTTPPFSVVAWSSFATCCNPGSHGVFGNRRFLPNSYQLKLNNAADVSLPYFWETVGHAGKRSLVFNVPNTYPVRPIHGSLIAGCLTPNEQAAFTHPAELKEEIRQFNYTIHTPSTKEWYASGQHDKIVRACYEVMDNQVKTYCYLMKTQPWDLAICVLTKGDDLQHHYWQDMLQGGDLKDILPN